MALPPEQKYANLVDIPVESRPEDPLTDIRSLPTGQGRRHQARRAPDGTRWCLTCHTTLQADGRQALCTPCTRERGRIRRGELRRTAAATSIPVPQAALEELIRHTRALEVGIGQLLAAVETQQSTDRAGRRLALASKHVSVLVTSEFLPLLREARNVRRQ